jgi:MGT family glycosyltransferase
MTTRDLLFTTWEGGGSVSPVLTAVRRLVARGHRVRVMSDACNRPEAEAAGAAFIPWTRAPSRPDRSRATDILCDWDVAEPIEGLGRMIDRIMAGPALAYAQDVMEELSRRPADLIVNSEILPGVSAAAEALGVPLALLSCNVSLFPLPGVPVLGPGFAPPKTQAEAAMQDEVRAATIAYFDRGLPPLNRARGALGLPPLACFSDHPQRADRLFLATACAFDFAPATLPERVLYVGPLLDEPAWAEPFRAPWPADDRRPLVTVSFSTGDQNQAPLLQRVADALGRLPVRGLITLGDVVRPQEIAAPANVKLLHSAPHDAVMREADLVVGHGGHGTTLRALVHGRPQLVLPQGRDQNDNAVRVTERRAGLSLPPTASAAEIEQALRRLLAEPAFAGAAARLGARIREEIERSPLISEIEALAAARSPTARAA